MRFASPWSDCPECGSAKVRLSRRHGAERLLGVFLRAYRCRGCHTRFWKIGLPSRKVFFRILFWGLTLVISFAVLWFMLERMLQPPPF